MLGFGQQDTMKTEKGWAHLVMLVVGKGPEEKMRIKIQAQSYMFTKKVKTEIFLPK